MPSKKRSLERNLEDQCIAAAAKESWIAHKLDRIPGTRGNPDEVFLGPNSTYFVVEFKLPGEEPTGQQEHRHKRYSVIGTPVYAVTTFGQFDVLLARYQMIAVRRAPSTRKR
jgi:hypothetical protein